MGAVDAAVVVVAVEGEGAFISAGVVVVVVLGAGSVTAGAAGLSVVCAKEGAEHIVAAIADARVSAWMLFDICESSNIIHGKLAAGAAVRGQRRVARMVPLASAVQQRRETH